MIEICYSNDITDINDMAYHFKYISCQITCKHLYTDTVNMNIFSLLAEFTMNNQKQWWDMYSRRVKEYTGMVMCVMYILAILSTCIVVLLFFMCQVTACQYLDDYYYI